MFFQSGCMVRGMIIGICGASGSGKTTFSRRLIQAIGESSVLHIPHDAYYRSLDELPPELREPVDQPRYDFVESRRLPEPVRLTPQPTIVVEGILVFQHEALRSRMDLKVFIDTPLDLCLARLFQRDIRERGRTVELIIADYLKNIRPMFLQFVEPTRKYADFVTTGDHPNTALIEDIVQRTRAATAPA
jgi:uridine kinase